MNKYLKDMKKALNGFYSTAVNYTNKAEEARRTYQPLIAEEQAGKFEEQLEAARQSAIAIVLEAKEKGIEAAKQWGVLDGNKINEGDLKLLKFDLTPEQFENIVERNRNNGTMCFILKQYAEKHAKGEMKEEEVYKWPELATVVIPTVEEKEKAYNAFADSAIAIINNISGSGWGKGIEGFGVASSVENFAEPNQVNYNMLEVLEG